MHTKTPTQETKIRSLSGGNQQKVILGRWLLTNPEVLLLDEPSLQKNFKLQPGEEARFVIMLGEGNREEGRRIRVKYSDLKRVDAVYTDLAAYWKQKYAALQIQTPNEGMNTLINTWTLYQSEINFMFEGC